MRVDVPVPPTVNGRLVELREAVRPAEGVRLRETVPEKLLRLVMVRVEVPDEPARIVRERGLGAMLKSATLTVTRAERVNVPLLALTVTLYVPIVDDVKLHAEVPDPPELSVMLVGLQETLSPVEGLTVLDIVRVPVKPLRLVTVAVELPDVPTLKVTVVGLAAMLKSGGATTLMLMVAEWEREPAVPFTVTV